MTAAAPATAARDADGYAWCIAPGGALVAGEACYCQLQLSGGRRGWARGAVVAAAGGAVDVSAAPDRGLRAVFARLPRARVVATERRRVVVVVEETDEFRKHVRAHATAGERVVEVGSSFGEGTAIAAECCGDVLGLDTSAELVAEARRRRPKLRFERIDAIAEPERFAALALGCTVCFVDVGGNRPLAPVCRVLETVLSVVEPTVVIVKSRALYRFLTTGVASVGVERAACIGGGGFVDADGAVADARTLRAALDAAASREAAGRTARKEDQALRRSERGAAKAAARAMAALGMMASPLPT